MKVSIWCRCNRVDLGDTSQLGMSACNTNASSNYMGSTVLLDVNSNTPGAPPVASAQDCCMACLANAQVQRRAHHAQDSFTLSLLILEANTSSTCCGSCLD